MKAKDAFALSIAGFVAANCASYFIYSNKPYVTGWGVRPHATGIDEAAGFPFVSYGADWVSIVPSFFWSWSGWLGNLVVAATASFLVAKLMARVLTPLWSDHARAFCCSGRRVVGSLLAGCLLFSICMASRRWALLVRNCVAIIGPVCVYSWWLYRRKLSWVRILVAGFAMAGFALAVDLVYQEPPIDVHAIFRAALPITPPSWDAPAAEHREYLLLDFTREWFTITAVRTLVPVFGLFSSLVLLNAAYVSVRARYGGLTGLLKKMSQTRYDIPDDDGADKER